MNSPSHQLAQTILKRLLREKLLSEQEAKKLLPKLASGNVQAEDWHLALEQSLARKTKQ